jgi:hypothetical protein
MGQPSPAEVLMVLSLIKAIVELAKVLLEFTKEQQTQRGRTKRRKQRR